ncbi:MAG: MBL fold metallo-hydrolase [Treponema sp.]|nr:MBL fold metallo-hydrolase [Candidatus Treponema equifaecale]
MKKLLLTACLMMAGITCFGQEGKKEEPVKEIEVKEIQKNLYSIEDPGSRQFFVVGKDKVLLFDTGFGRSSVMEKIRKYSDLPVEVAITHGHGDHVSGLKEFGSCWISEKDASMIPEGVEARIIKEGDKLSCGGYTFEVVEIPGHTEGSVVYLDKKKKIMIGGDSIQPGPIFMFGDVKKFDDYIASMEKLNKLSKYIKQIYPAHNASVVGPEYIKFCIEDAKAFKEGKLVAEEIQMMGKTRKVYKGKNVSFFAD